MLHFQTASVNNPVFIELQHRTLKYFVSGDYTFSVCNDAKSFPDYSNFGNIDTRRAISDICAKLNIPCVTNNNAHHARMPSAAERTADVLNVMLAAQVATRDKYMIIDSDMFPIAPFSTTKYDAYDAAVIPQIRSSAGNTVKYFWNGICYLNMDKLEPRGLLNWGEGNVEGVWTDVGGAMCGFLRNSTNAIYEMSHNISCQWSSMDYPLDLDMAWLDYMQNDVRNVGSNFYCELYDRTFLHFRAGGNWTKGAEDVYNSNVNNLVRAVDAVCRG